MKALGAFVSVLLLVGCTGVAYRGQVDDIVEPVLLRPKPYSAREFTSNRITVHVGRKNFSKEINIVCDRKLTREAYGFNETLKCKTTDDSAEKMDFSFSKDISADGKILDFRFNEKPESEYEDRLINEMVSTQKTSRTFPFMPIKTGSVFSKINMTPMLHKIGVEVAGDVFVIEKVKGIGEFNNRRVIVLESELESQLPVRIKPNLSVTINAGGYRLVDAETTLVLHEKSESIYNLSGRYGETYKCTIGSETNSFPE